MRVFLSRDQTWSRYSRELFDAPLLDRLSYGRSGDVQSEMEAQVGLANGHSTGVPNGKPKVAYRTQRGSMYCSTIENFLDSEECKRLRAIVASTPAASSGSKGRIHVELHVSGRPTLSDARDFVVVPAPRAKPAKQQLVMPPFEVKPVEDQEDPMWTTLGWPDDQNAIASSAVREEGRLIVYYSRVFPYFSQQFDSLERRDAGIAASFESRYKIWLAVHSLIMDKEQDELETDEEIAEQIERRERCRIATIAAMFAAAEVKRPETPLED